jgi:hypothetical protein
VTLVTYVPDEHLIQRYSLTFSFEPKLLTAVLSQFGQLPIGGQEQLIRRLYQAFGQYQLLAKSKCKITHSKIRKQLAAVESTTFRLLLQLGVNPNKVPEYEFWDVERLQQLRKQDEGGLYLVDKLSVAGIETAGKDESAVTAESQEAGRRVMDTVFGLLDLHERAKKAVQTATNRTAPGKGGWRRRPDAEGQLIRDAIAIYEHMRGQYPESGAKPGYVRFIHAVAALFGTCVREADIRKAWSTHTRKSKLK